MLNYAFDGGTVMPVAFNSDGTFSQALDLSRACRGKSHPGRDGDGRRGQFGRADAPPDAVHGHSADGHRL